MYYLGFLSMLIVCVYLIEEQCLGQHQRRTARDAVALIEDLLNKSDNRIRPSIYEDPVEVKIDFFLKSYGPLNEVDMDVGVDLYFRQRWVDRRLEYDPVLSESVIIPRQLAHLLWQPDLYFPNEKSESILDAPRKNHIIKVYPNGTVLTSLRVSMRMSCNMALLYFPLDHQKCAIQISSYSYDINDVTLAWLDDSPVEIRGNDLSLRQFQLIEISTHFCNSSFKTGDFPCLEAIFHLRREVGFYILQTYIPCILIVSLSWVSFWINVNAIPARISLGITTVLTMTTQLSSSKSSAMPVSYPKAIDVWFAMCMLFVFGAFMEYAYAHVLNRHQGCQKPVRSPKKDINETHLEDSPMCTVDNTDKENRKWLGQSHEQHTTDTMIMAEQSQIHYRTWPFSGPQWTAHKLDKVSRVMFPAAFLIFNILYWSVYTRPIVSQYYSSKYVIPDGDQEPTARDTE